MPAKIMNYPLSDEGRANWDGIFTPDVRHEATTVPLGISYMWAEELCDDTVMPMEYLGVPEINDTENTEGKQ